MTLTATLGFTGFGVWKMYSQRPAFQTAGYVLQGDAGEVKRVDFASRAPYVVSRAGYVQFRDAAGEKTKVRRDSFVHLEDGSVMALADGVLMDFNDLSENFINNYFITAGLTIGQGEGVYTAQTSSGAVSFGENLWKISDSKYLIRSPKLTVSFSENDRREVEGYVQVSRTEDGIVQLLTPENLWSTISDECYIETAAGVRIYPVRQMLDNGTYKMSMAKLSVSPDDSIVLSEDETRRQIVPELKFEAIDGADGADGQSGETGKAGEAGRDGEAGENGQDGEKGQTGDDGRSGQNGESGRGGQSGSDGSAGQSGQTGMGGQNGQNGQSGQNGQNGQSGENGSRGGTGPTGNAAQIQSTTNTALPTMTFSEWHVSSTRLRGAIQVKDESELFENLPAAASSSAYDASVTIYNTRTGAAYPCYHTNETYEIIDAGAPGIKSNQIHGGANLYFSTAGAPLEPDTAYRISVVAYYAANEMVYSREFISREFYTDSAGVYMSYDSATDNSLTVRSLFSDVGQQSISKAEILLLTREQNQGYSALKKDTVFTRKIALGFTGGSITSAVYFDSPDSSSVMTRLPLDGVLTFGGLTANRDYVCRAYVESVSGGTSMTALTSQELGLRTLKRIPQNTAGVNPKPDVFFNRVTGAFEVYHPHVTDPDGGIVRYIYTPYKVSDTGLEPCSQLTGPAGSDDPMSFFLSPGVEYVFGVEIEFFDNEKTVTFDLGKSSPIRSEGDTMPRVDLTVNPDTGVNYDKMSGTLSINLTGQYTSLKVDTNHPLKLTVYADRIYDRTVTIQKPGVMANGSTVGGVKCNATLDGSYHAGSTKADVALELDHLYQNTNYTITVTGYLNLNEKDGDADARWVRRTIGTVSFRTYATASVPLVAKWSPIESGEGGMAIQRRLQIEPHPLDGSDAQKAAQEAYVKQQLSQGQLMLKLSRGTGPSRQLLSSVTINSNDARLQEIFGAGAEINEKLFGSSLVKSESYTLEIGLVADATATMPTLGYVNTFDVMAGKSVVVTAAPTPPDLLPEPTGGITATPILNKFVTTYGGIHNKELADEAIVGYLLQANYDNSQRLAQKVTYYPFEYTTFYNALISKQDPVKMTLDAMRDPTAGDVLTVVEPIVYEVDHNSDTVPGVALLFGTDQEGKTGPRGMSAGYSVYFAGDKNLQGTKLKGMGRGFRYVFAYTVEYSIGGGEDSSSTAVYPYGNGQKYREYKAAYGAGREFGKPIGKGTAYILNSGMCEAPKVTPEFHTYVAGTSAQSWGMSGSSGMVTIHYAWRDTDGAISEQSPITQIKYETNSGVMKYANINEKPLPSTTDLQWYEITVPYSTGANEGEELPVSPIVETTVYEISYDAILKALRSGTAYEDYDSNFYLCHIPVDRAYSDYFSRSEMKGRVLVEQMPNLEENYIDFVLRDNTGSTLSSELGARAYALKLTFSLAEDSAVTRTVYLPMNYSVTGYYARLATGELGSEFVGKKFKVDASLLYDDGNMGWSLIEGGKAFALQYINKVASTDRADFVLSAYAGSSSMGSGGALMTQTYSGSGALTAEKLRNLLKLDPKEDQTAYFPAKNVGGGRSFAWYVYPRNLGVDSSGYDSVEGMGDRYMIPKGMGVYDLSFPQKSDGTAGNEGELNRITPTIQVYGLWPASTNIGVGTKYNGRYENGFRVFSQEGAGTELVNGEQRYVVHARLYDTKEHAEEMDVIGEIGGVTTVSLTLINDGDRKGYAEDPADDSYLIRNLDENAPGLEQNHSYYLAFYMTDKTGRNTVLIDKLTARKAVYKVTTTDDVKFESDLGVVYRNEGYFDKQLMLFYSLSRSAGVSMYYDIWETDAAGKEQLVLSHDELVNSYMLVGPTDVVGREGNEMTITMTPGAQRSKLKPGGRYILRLTAKENTTPGTHYEKNNGVQDYEFRLPPVSNYGALIYVKEATNRTITYQVSMNDVEYSYMGEKDYKQGVGLFAVRFTDESGTWIQTPYDGRVYDATVAQQEFVLNLPAAGAGVPNSYILKVYAVVDRDHDGLSEAVEIADSTGRGPAYFFGEKAEDAAVGGKFRAFLDRFWENGANGFKNKADMDGIEDGFCVATRQQSRTDDTGLLINEKKAALTRKSTNRIELVLAESFGVVTREDENLKHAFAQIDWDVNGYANDKKVIHYSGTNYSDNRDGQFRATKDRAGFDIFTYEIPQDIPGGSYTVTIQLRKAKNSPSYDYQFSFTLVG